MPRLIRVSIETPVTVDAATRVFGTPLRVHLVRYFLDNPGPQKDAAAALGVTRGAVSANTAALIADGVVVETPSADKRSHTYRVDRGRLSELLDALGDFTLPPDVSLDKSD